MFKNYFKVAIRNLVRAKIHTFINIIGLAIGMTCFLLILSYARQELSYDKFHEKSDSIYRVVVEFDRPQGKIYSACTPYPVGPSLKAEYPEIQKMARIYMYGEPLIKANDKPIYEKNFFFAETEFLDIFTFPFVQGDPVNALLEPNTILISESVAKKYFGEEEAIGKILQFENKIDFTITGVFKDVPANSHFHFDFLASFSNVTKDFLNFNPEQWGAFWGIFTYVLLPENVAIPSFEAKIASFYDEHAGKESSASRRLLMQPITDIHLHSHMSYEIEPNNSPVQLIVLGVIALFILLIACINFINLTTARSSRRAREVGLRKTLGAGRGQLVRQYLGESILLSFFALGVSLFLAEVLLPVFSELIGKNIDLNYLYHLSGLGSLSILTVVVGACAGFYPALVLSAYRPTETMKTLTKHRLLSLGTLNMRKFLVIFQFAISIILISATLIIHSQMRFFRETNLGFDKELMLTIPMNDEKISKQYEVVKNTFLKNPGVVKATTSLKAPIGSSEMVTNLYPQKNSDDGKFNISLNFIDYNFIDFFSLKLLAGRNFSPEFTADKQQTFILNESAIQKMGFSDPQEAIGKKARIGINDIEGTIIGVVENFHIQSLHETITPLVMMYNPDYFNVFTLKIQPNDIAGTLSFLEKTWQEFNQTYPFQYSFLDEYIAHLYLSDEKMERTIEWFALLAIVVSCLGLVGLASFSAEQRTKELGVRKVLGATVINVTAILSHEFTRLVLIANLVAWPVAYYAMNKWLQNFAYHIEISLWIFFLSGGLALVIALVTVSTIAIRAALANPVESLRYE